MLHGKWYPEFGHWHKIPDEIDDIVLFLEEKVDDSLVITKVI